MAVFTASYQIHTYEADVNGKATFPSLFRYLQDIAANHAKEIGYGLDDLRENSHMWVLSRFLFRSRRIPRWQETMRIDTWPSGTDRLLALRDWLVSDEEGQEVAVATSGWAVIDIEKRTPVRVEKVADRMDMIVDRHLFERSPQKIPSPQAASPCHDVRARFADMDLNGHVNATRYIEWMFEGLPAGFREKGWEPAEIEVNFSGESRSGDEIEIFISPAGGDSAEGSPAAGGTPSLQVPREAGSPAAPRFLHSAVKKSDGTVLCRARSLWREAVS